MESLLRWAEVGHAPAAAVVFIAALWLFTALAEPVLLAQAGGAPADPRVRSSILGSSLEPSVRVRVASERTEIEVAGPMHVIASLIGRDGGVQLVRTPVKITRTARSWVLEGASGRTRAVAFVGADERRAPLSLRALGPDMLTIAGKDLPGEIRLLPDIVGTTDPLGPVSDTKFHVVEHIGLETYLPGVIAKELISGWDIEAFRVQAIAARSYALHERERSMNLGQRWDLEATELDQVYAGATTNPRALQAVRDTRGMVLTWRGTVLRAYYSSTSGGRSASAKDVWPTGPGFEFNLAGPIQGYGSDEYSVDSPLHRWTVERDVTSLTRRLRAFGKDREFAIRSIDRLAGASVAGTNEFGRPNRYRITGSGGTWYELSAEQLRMACNWTGSSGLPAVDRKTRVNSGDLGMEVRGGTVFIRGRGFGHGVGMCQYGTQKQAKMGRTASEILMHYYPGAELSRAYY